MGAGMNEHDAAVRAASAHVAAKGGSPLSPLPAGFADSRATMHRVAEEVLKTKRVLETGNEIALRFTPGGFGTPPWERGQASGKAGSIRVEGTAIVTTEGDEEDRREIPGADPAGAAALADWFAYGTVVLAGLLAGAEAGDPEPIRLWPEHFDVATVVGSEQDGARANYGASPGDDDHDEPYLYVGPWDQTLSGDLWDATGFVGAELGYRDLLGESEQVDAGIAFMRARLLG